MKMLMFARRNAREILRDPMTAVFSLGFPIVVLLLLTAIQSNIPVQLFEIGNLAPGVAVFGLSFLTLFTAQLVARDRESALQMRLYASPMRPVDFLLGYALPVLPMALAQYGICIAVAMALGLSATPGILRALLGIVPVSLFFIALGLLCGSALTGRQAGVVCGAVLANLTAWLSGTWFDMRLVGEGFQKIANALPFAHAVELERALLKDGGGFEHLPWVLCYALAAFAAAVPVFLRQTRRR